MSLSHLSLIARSAVVGPILKLLALAGTPVLVSSVIPLCLGWALSALPQANPTPPVADLRSPQGVASIQQFERQKPCGDLHDKEKQGSSPWPLTGLSQGKL